MDSLIGCDVYIWGVSIMVPTVLLKIVFPQYINGNKDFGIGLMFGNIILTSMWAQLMPEKQNPFVSKGDHMLIFTNNSSANL